MAFTYTVQSIVTGESALSTNFSACQYELRFMNQASFVKEKIVDLHDGQDIVINTCFDIILSNNNCILQVDDIWN